MKKNLKFKKWLYFIIQYLSGGIMGYNIYRYCQTNDYYFLITALGMSLVAIASFIQWKYIFNLLNHK